MTRPLSNLRRSKQVHNTATEPSRSAISLQALLDNIPVAIYLVDEKYQLVAINKTRYEKLDKSEPVLINRPCYKALFDRDEPCPACLVQKTIQTGVTIKRFERRKYPAENFSEWEISTSPIFVNEEKPTQAMIIEQDVTEKHYLENILTQSEKLAIIGQLAASLAHELNNPLTAILANAQMIQRSLPPGHDLQESVDLISRAGNRAAQVVQNLLDFARKEDFLLTPTNIHTNIQHAIDLIQHEFTSHNINLEFLPSPNLPLILASKDHLQSVWLNLLVNAVDSMDKPGGQIRLVTRHQQDTILVIISDNGAGIPSERLEHIFEPFYTTKTAGHGTGLGLSICQRIVKQHGGSIDVESQPGSGTKFMVTLPIIEQAPADE